MTGAQDHRGGQGTGQRRQLLTVTPSATGEFQKLSMAMVGERTFHPLLEILILDASTHRRDQRHREGSIKEDQDKEQFLQEDNQTEMVRISKQILTKETPKDSFHNKQDNKKNQENNNNDQDNNKASTKASTHSVLTASQANP